MLTYEERVAIRQYYAENHSVIMNATGFGIDKYHYRWMNKMSPIERIVFDECVSAGLVMYPEYPIGPYWVDLGNPRDKVAIECDGKEYHLDARKDAIRHNEIEQAYGWKIYRISGSEIMTGATPPDDATDDDYSHWLSMPGLEQFIDRIRRKQRLVSREDRFASLADGFK
jgi:hypothetical protein